MKKYKNIDEFLADKDLTREELISLRNPEKKEYIKIKKLEKND